MSPGPGAAGGRGPTLTLFCLPKPFTGHTALIQENALRSWARLRPEVEVLVLGEETGAAETATRLGARHLPEVARNAHGTPLVDDLFRRAESAAGGELLAYVNADIVLGAGFLEAVRRVFRRRRRALMVGRRVDLDVDAPIELDHGGEERLAAEAERRGRLHAATGIDYFVYPPGLLGEIPPFALGRTIWDNWLLFQARARGGWLVDATEAVLAIHQNHDYAHHPGGVAGVWKGEEAEHNRRLAGGPDHLLTIDDATHRLTRGDLRAVRGLFRLYREAELMGALHPRLRPLSRLLLRALELSYPVRARLGLTGSREAGSS